MLRESLKQQEVAIEVYSRIDMETVPDSPVLRRVSTVLLVFSTLMNLFITGFAFWLYADKDEWHYLTHRCSWHVGSRLLITAGFLSIPSLMYGFLSPWRREHPATVVFILSAFVVTCFTAAAAVDSFTCSETLKDKSADLLERAKAHVALYGEPVFVDYTRGWDSMQGSLRCCGMESYTEWYESNWYASHGIFPPSCCNSSITSCDQTEGSIHTTPCGHRFIAKYLYYLKLVAGVSFTSFLNQVAVLGVAFLWFLHLRPCFKFCTDPGPCVGMEEVTTAPT